MTAKIIITGEQGFRDRAGQHLFTSDPWAVTKDRIQDFCRSVDNEEWFHWDEQAVRASPLGSIIAPGFMAPALAPKAYWDHVSLRDLDGLFLGADRIRLLQPVRVGDHLVQEWRIDRVEDRDKGIAVYYDVTWRVEGRDGPAGVATYVVRYWNNPGQNW
jgi:acyl dehydratase